MGGTDHLEHLGAGVSLIVGTASADGEPRATRAWAARIVEREPLRVRFVMSADDPVAVANLASGMAVALTGADVCTLGSVQVKGSVRLTEPAGADDLALATAQSERFMQAVHETDGNAIELLRRMLPREVVCVELDVDERYDQSPGPGAGRLLEAR